MKITIPSELKGKELFTFLLANKEALIAEKKAMPMKYTDTLSHKAIVKYFSSKTGATKDDNGNTEDPTDPNKLHVTAVANVFLYMDSQYDVLLPGCCKRTIKERKGKFVQLHDHIYKIDAKIGEVTDVYTKDIQLSELGVLKTGSVESLIFEFDAIKSYNEQIFNQYKAGKVDQYSIGLQYVSLDIAINDPDSPKEIEFWNKHINQIINRDAAIEAGFFFVVSEIKLLENSAVLFGANDLTMTLAVAGKSVKKDAGTYTEGDNSEAVTYIDQLTKRHKKSIKLMDDCQDDDDMNHAELMSHCDNMKSDMQGHIIKMQEIKDKILSGKSHSIPDTHKDEPSPVVIEFDSLKAIKEFKFLTN